jgi:hypothetical protein
MAEAYEISFEGAAEQAQMNFDYSTQEYEAHQECSNVTVKAQLHSAMRMLVQMSKGNEKNFQKGLKTFPASAGNAGKTAAKAAAPKKRSVADQKKTMETSRKTVEEPMCGGCAVQ